MGPGAEFERPANVCRFRFGPVVVKELVSQCARVSETHSLYDMYLTLSRCSTCEMLLCKIQTAGYYVSLLSLAVWRVILDISTTTTSTSAAVVFVVVIIIIIIIIILLLIVLHLGSTPSSSPNW